MVQRFKRGFLVIIYFDCRFGLVVVSTAGERGVLGSVHRSGKKFYWFI